MTSPLSYLYHDQDIFNYSNPNDLSHIYREEGQTAFVDTSWSNFNANQQIPQQELQQTFEQRNNFLPRPAFDMISRPSFEMAPPMQIQESSQRSSTPEKMQFQSNNFDEEFSSDSSIGAEDNGMEFFFEEETSMEASSYDMESFINDHSSNEDIIVEESISSSPSSNFHAQEKKFKLQSSKSPVVDALFFCALTKQGITLVDDGEKSKMVQFRLHDFNLYYNKSKDICSKAHPTDDVNSRVKALQRWFPDFPSLKELQRGIPWVFGLSREKNHVNFGKLQVILERQRALLRGEIEVSPRQVRKNSRGT